MNDCLSTLRSPAEVKNHERRITGHLVWFDTMGIVRIDHPVACGDTPQECKVWRAINDGRVVGSLDRGAHYAILLDDGSVRCYPASRYECGIHSRQAAVEINGVLDRFVEEVGAGSARAVLQNYVNDQLTPNKSTVVDL